MSATPSTLESQTTTEMQAEEKKALGNKAFAAEDYKEAIARYSEAIELDPQKHTYYSNRSACYAFINDWDQSAADAKTCIEKDPSFLKGYFRLSVAQLELKQYQEAIDTVEAGLRKQSDNPDLRKQLRIAKARKHAAEAAKLPAGAVDTSLSAEELQEVQEQYRQSSRELKEVLARSSTLRTDRKKTELTLAEVGKLGDSTPLYKSLGKLFLRTAHDKVLNSLNNHMGDLDRRTKDLEAKEAYLTEKVTSQESTLRRTHRMAAT